MHPYVVLDVFADAPLKGNPVAVFSEGDKVPEALMQGAARELNLSETVFLLPPGGNAQAPSTERDAQADARLRIFTPATELPFAGHPVLGAAFVVGERLGESRVRLETGAGTISVRLELESGRIVFGEMEQPIPVAEPFERTTQLLSALGLERSELPVGAYRNGPLHVFVAVASEEKVAALKPDLRALESLGAFGVSCFAGAGRRFKTRMFAPGLGVGEDPATGSAAGPLAGHLAMHGRINFFEQIEIRQGQEIGRPSLLLARVEGDAQRVERILVGGSAVLVARGEYRLA